MPSDTFDVIIVGGGTAGLVLANRLSEDPNLQVVVLESGDDRGANPNTLTPGAWPLSQGPSDWKFQTMSQTGFPQGFPQGRTLGGSSAINGFIFTPTSKASVQGWHDLGNDGWDYASFSEALRKACTVVKPSGSTMGTGPLQLTMSAPEDVWDKAWINGLESLGFTQSDPFSGQVCGPVIAAESIDPKTKQRSYSANAFLVPARQRPNLTVLTDATVTKVLIERSALGQDAVAKGVQVISKDGIAKSITARKEVIIAAGAINSPRLLELSGVGGAELLKSLGIDVLVDNPQVGENLQNHPYTGLSFEVVDDVETLDAFFRQEPAVVSAVMQEYATKGTGPLSSSNMRTTAQLPLPDFHGPEGRKALDELLKSFADSEDVKPRQLTTSTFAAAHEKFVLSTLTNSSEAVATYIFAAAYAPFDAPDPTYRAPGKFVTVAINMSHPLSHGSVHINTSTAEKTATSEGVAIDAGHLSHPLDLEVFARQLRFIEDAVSRAEPLAKYIKPRTNHFSDLEKAKEYIRRTAQGAHHFTGTCSMMPQAMGGVVDEKLRVYGCPNLRVCDASIIPIAPTANPQANIYAVAGMGADFIKESVA